MGTYGYLIDKTSKVKIPLRGIDKEDFLVDIEKIETILPVDYDRYAEDGYILEDTPINAWTISDYEHVSIGEKFLRTLLELRNPPMAYFYFINIIKGWEHDWDFVHEDEVKKKYKDYKELD